MKAAVKEAGTNPHVEGELQEFFLLADVLPEDRLLRQGLQQKRLVGRTHQRNQFPFQK